MSKHPTKKVTKDPKGRGRPSKKSEPVVNKIMELARQGKTDQEIADITGITKRTLQNWRVRDFEFFSSFKEAINIANQAVEASLFQKAIGYSHVETKVFCNDGSVTKVDVVKKYPPDPVAAKFWLMNKKPEAWKEKVEHTGEDGGAIKLSVVDYRNKDGD